MANFASLKTATDKVGHCECICCVIAPIASATKGLVDHCCKCCGPDGCTPSEHKAAFDAAKKLLDEAQRLLAECMSAVA